MDIDFDHNLRLLNKDKFFLEKKLLKDSRCRSYLKVFAKDSRLVNFLEGEIEKENGKFTRALNLSQSEKIDNYYLIIKELSSDFEIPFPEKLIEAKKKQEITIAPRIIDNFINTDTSIVDRYFSLLLNDNYSKLKFWELIFIQRDMFHFYSDFIAVDSGGKVILCEIKVDDNYSLDQYLKYLRIYRDAIGKKRDEYTNIKHLLISPKTWDKPLKIDSGYWSKIEDNHLIEMKASKILEYIKDNKKRSGQKIRKILAPTISEEDINKFKIYFRNFDDLYSTSTNLVSDLKLKNTPHSKINEFITNLKEISEVTRR